MDRDVPAGPGHQQPEDLPLLTWPEVELLVAAPGTHRAHHGQLCLIHNAAQDSAVPIDGNVFETFTSPVNSRTRATSRK
jgi:hypothetical protein